MFQMGNGVKQTYQSTQVVPDLGDVRIQAYSTGICIQRIAILVNLVVQDTNRAPECWIPAVAIYGLLIRLICLGVFLL